MKKNSAFQLRSGNKPSMAKIAGVSPMKADGSGVEEMKKLGLYTKTIASDRGSVTKQKEREKKLIQTIRAAFLQGKFRKWSKANPDASQDDWMKAQRSIIAEQKKISDYNILKQAGKTVY